MACAGCERRRRVMKEALAKGMAHAARLLALRRGENPDVQAEGATEQAVTATGAVEAGAADGSAGNKAPQHEQRRVEGAAKAGAGKRRASVPVVRKAGSGKASPR